MERLRRRCFFFVVLSVLATKRETNHHKYGYILIIEYLIVVHLKSFYNLCFIMFYEYGLYVYCEAIGNKGNMHN